MTILIAGDSAGGAFTFMATLARGLVRRGCRVAVAAIGPQPPPAVDGVRVLWQAGAAEWMTEPWADVDAAGPWLLDLAAGVGAEVVHLNCYSHAALPFPAPVVLTAHSDVLSWWRAVHGGPAPDRYREYQRRVRAGLAAADLVTAPTRAALAALEAELGPVRNGRVIPNGVEAAASGAPKERLVLAAGRLWDEAKNIASLCGVRLPAGWTLAAAGSIHHPDGRDARLPGLGLLGELGAADLRAWMDRAAVYVNAALYEPFGLGVAEAALAGCALALSDIPSLRETWDGAALFFEPGAPQAALTALTEDAGLRQELAGRARDRAARFSAAAMVDAYLGCYAQVARGGDLPCAS